MYISSLYIFIFYTLCVCHFLCTYLVYIFLYLPIHRRPDYGISASGPHLHNSQLAILNLKMASIQAETCSSTHFAIFILFLYFIFYVYVIFYVYTSIQFMYFYIYPSTEGLIMRSQHPVPHLHNSQLAILNLKMASIQAETCSSTVI